MTNNARWANRRIKKKRDKMATDMQSRVAPLFRPGNKAINYKDIVEAGSVDNAVKNILDTGDAGKKGENKVL